MHAKPLKIPLRWSAVFVLVNAGAAALLVLDQFGASLSEEEQQLFESHFSQTLTRGQFYQLLQLSKKETIDDGTVLTKEGQISPYLYFILDGQAKVYHNKTFAAYVDQGGFVNDVAFQQQQEQQIKRRKSGSSGVEEDSNSQSSGIGAYGTVITNGTCQVLVWDSEDLQRRLANQPQMDRNLKYLLSQHLMKSLLKQREARHAKAKEQQEDPEGWYSTASTATVTATSSATTTAA